MTRFLFLLYGIVAYLFFCGTILYAIGFTGNLVVPKTIDGTPQVSLMAAIATDIGLMLLFALQHSLITGSSFRRRWAKMVPPPLERCTAVLVASGCLMLMMWLWQPIGGIIWSVSGLAGKGLLQFFFFLGWGLVFISTLLISHFDLFGLRQVWFYFNGRQYTPTPVRTPLYYRFVRNPLCLGFVLACWCTPVMTSSHLLFAIICSGYIINQFRVSGVGFRVATAVYNH